MKLLEDLKLTGRMLGCHQVTAEVLGPEAVRFSSQCVFFFFGGGKTRFSFMGISLIFTPIWGRFPI